MYPMVLCGCRQNPSMSLASRSNLAAVRQGKRSGRLLWFITDEGTRLLAESVR